MSLDDLADLGRCVKSNPRDYPVTTFLICLILISLSMAGEKRVKKSRGWGGVFALRFCHPADYPERGTGRAKRESVHGFNSSSLVGQLISLIVTPSV